MNLKYLQQQILPNNLLRNQSTMMKQSTTCHTSSMSRAREILECMGMMIMTNLLRKLTVMTQPSTCHISSMSRARKNLECMGMMMMTQQQILPNNLLREQSMMMKQSTTCHISSMSRARKNLECMS